VTELFLQSVVVQINAWLQFIELYYNNSSNENLSNDSSLNRQFIAPTVYRTDSLSNRQFIERQFIETTVHRTTVYRTTSLSNGQL